MMESSSSGSQTPDYDKITGVLLFIDLLCLMHCVRSVQSLLFSANVLNVSCVTVAHTVFGLQIAGVKPSET